MRSEGTALTDIVHLLCSLQEAGIFHSAPALKSQHDIIEIDMNVLYA